MTEYTQTDGSGGSIVYVDGATVKPVAGEKCATTNSLLYGKKITNIQCYMHRQNSVSGTIYARHRASDHSIKYTYWSFAASTLPTSDAWLMDGSAGSEDTAFEAGDYFTFEYDGSSQYVVSYFGSGFDGTESYFTRSDGSGGMTDYTSNDIMFKITVEAAGPSPSAGTRLPPPPAMVRL